MEELYANRRHCLRCGDRPHYHWVEVAVRAEVPAAVAYVTYNPTTMDQSGPSTWISTAITKHSHLAETERKINGNGNKLTNFNSPRADTCLIA